MAKTKSKINDEILLLLKSIKQLKDIELRKKIYPSTSDKAFYQKVMDGKKRKIEDIALRNKLKTIFNDSQLKIVFYQQIHPQFNFPKFIYPEPSEQSIS